MTARRLWPVMWAATAAILATVLAVPVDWPVTNTPPPQVLMRIGPVSSYIVPGQTLAAKEGANAVAIPIRVGGPFGAKSKIGLAIYSDTGSATVLASASAMAVSGPAQFEPTMFRLDRKLEAGRAAYMELKIPEDNPWPIFVAGTKADTTRQAGSLYLRREAQWPDQDLAYQLFRRSALVQRLADLWNTNQAASVTAVVTLVAVGAVWISLGLALSGQNRRMGGTTATLSLAVLAAGTYFYLFL